MQIKAVLAEVPGSKKVVKAKKAGAAALLADNKRRHKQLAFFQLEILSMKLTNPCQEVERQERKATLAPKAGEKKDNGRQ